MKDIVDNIKDRVKLLQERKTEIEKEHETAISELSYAEPSNIKLKINSKNRDH